MSISTTSGRSAAGELDGLGAVARLPDDLDVVLGVEQRPEPGAYEHLVVGEDNPDHWPTVPRGHDLEAAVADAVAVRSSPPVDSTRSRMPTSPNPVDDRVARRCACRRRRGR